MAESQHPVRVVKLGGSLLDLDGLKQRIEDWIGRQTTANTIWVVGGGALVEDIRRQDEYSTLSDEEVHWNCVKKMDDNAELIAAWFPDWKRFDSFDDLKPVGLARNWILSHLSWSRRHASHLPMSWDVTSDSISATLAHWIGASELVLLKSTDPPAESDFNAAITRGFIDGYFLKALKSDWRFRSRDRLSVRFVNFRSESFQETLWAD